MTDHTTTQPAAIAVPNPLPGDTIVALSAEVMAKATDLIARAGTVTEVTTPETLTDAEALFLDCDALAKSINGERMTVTRQLDALKKTIMQAEEQATHPLMAEKRRIGQLCTAYRNEVRRQREEAERRAREEAERKAAEERKRLEEERQRIIAEQEAERQRREEEAALFGGDETPAPIVEPPPVVVEPVIEPEPIDVPDLGKSAVRTTTRQRMVIDDPSKIPMEIGGKRLWNPDEKAIDKLLRAGVEVPGCRLESYEVVGKAGR